ncbi:uncharacterized protein PITG_20575 [Phytophthora infestans T30-4]|uniref:Uncharacterized protein n=1 Tax=Phytophthora infestans (strain T30-4) TaxID=403677 RepID=D0P301_PHYIT|nr:uncharacterized protein PITG_20575 [Phytophthora infestans T30-4]EEY58528.1 conserved hypothetical protein [Phytophthora infestans T30-4]|eukprot:XP_002895321.1 conserved hypothetical protein [Phytophthora infestans T30-4]
MEDKQKPHEDVLTRLVRDLETKTTLCYVKDYPGVELEQLNNHAKKLHPLVNPVFGEQPAFFIDEGRFCPYRMVVYGNMKVAAKIAELLGEWAKWSGVGGRVTTSQGAFILGQRLGKPNPRRKLTIPGNETPTVSNRRNRQLSCTRIRSGQARSSEVNLSRRLSELPVRRFVSPAALMKIKLKRALKVRHLQLKLKRLKTTKRSAYVDVGDVRKSMDRVTLETLVFLHCNRSLWSVYTVEEVRATIRRNSGNSGN